VENEAPENSSQDTDLFSQGGENSEESTTEISQDLSEDQDSPSPSQDSSGKKTSGEVEFVSVTDHTGRKVKLKVDYSDKDSIKRAYSMAAGARKWQAERDNLKKEFDSFKSTSESGVKNWNLISSVYEEKGIKGLVNFLEGGEDAFERLVEQHQNEREFFTSASPEQIEAYQAKTAVSQKDRELDKIRKDLEGIKQSQLTAKEETEISSIKAEINPIFDKYRFAGKLGNPTNEHKLDAMLWNTVMKELESFPEDQSISPVQLNKLFRDYSSLLRQQINEQADKKASKTLQTKKRQSTEKAQVQAVKQMTSPTSNSVGDYLKNGDITGLFKSVASKNKNFMGR